MGFAAFAVFYFLIMPLLVLHKARKVWKRNEKISLFGSYYGLVLASGILFSLSWGSSSHYIQNFFLLLPIIYSAGIILLRSFLQKTILNLIFSSSSIAGVKPRNLNVIASLKSLNLSIYLLVHKLSQLLRHVQQASVLIDY